MTTNNFKNAYALAQLGLYETMNLVRWNGDDSFCVDVDNDEFCIIHKGDKTPIKISMSIIRAHRLDSLNWDFQDDE